MSPESGTMLLDHIAPRLRSAIPRNVRMVGAEDEEELVQDAIPTAAQMLDAVERNAKTVTRHCIEQISGQLVVYSASTAIPFQKLRDNVSALTVVVG